MAVLVDHDGRSAVRFGVLREHGVDVEFGNAPVFGDGHADHRPLRNRRIVLVALERARIVFESVKRQRSKTQSRQPKQQFARDRIFVRTT